MSIQFHVFNNLHKVSNLTEIHKMSNNTNPNNNSEVPSDIVKRFQYASGLLYHWIESFGLEETLNHLENFRQPFESLWVQVNNTKIDFESLIDIFEAMEFEVSKHPWFNDFLLVKVGKKEIEEDVLLYPVVKVDRESASSIALGKDVNTASITSHNSFLTGDKVRIMDFAGNIIALGKAMVNSKEILALSQRVVVKVTDSLGYVPPLTELKEYRKGYFSILTPTQAIGVKSMYLESKDNILVMSGDRGEVAGYIAELTNNKCPITVVAQNKMQLKAINRQVERLQTKAIRILHSPFHNLLKEKHEVKYTSIYIEPQNSRTAVIPTFASNLSLNRLEKMSNDQIDIITSLYRLLHKEASISYVTHSIDYLENELVFQSILEKAYYEAQSFPQEIKNLQNKSILNSREMSLTGIMKKTKEQESSTIFLNPSIIKNIGGFVAKFKFKSR